MAPTQALYFLNSPFFHAQADKLTTRLFAAPEAQRLNELFRIALQRDPTPRDREFAGRFLDEYQTELSSRPAPERARSAWAALTRVILASNEFLFVE